MDNTKLHKSINFYDIDINILPIFSQSKLDYNFQKLMIEAFPVLETYKFNNDIIVDIIESEECLFGSIGKLRNIKHNPLTRARNIETLNKSEINLPKDQKLEEFTYFYIDYNYNKALVLRNDDAPNFIKTLKLLFKNVRKISEKTQRFDIYPEIISDISSTLNKFIELCKIDLVYKDHLQETEQKNSYIPSVKEIYEKYDNQLSKVALSLTFKNEIATHKILEEFKNNRNYNDLENLKITGKVSANEDITDTVDLLKKIITKKVIIEIENDDILKYEQKVKCILRDQLFANIK